MGFSLMNRSFGGTPIYGTPQMMTSQLSATGLLCLTFGALRKQDLRSLIAKSEQAGEKLVEKDSLDMLKSGGTSLIILRAIFRFSFNYRKEMNWSFFGGTAVLTLIYLSACWEILGLLGCLILSANHHLPRILNTGEGNLNTSR